jgi:hypothetical protein
MTVSNVGGVVFPAIDAKRNTQADEHTGRKHKGARDSRRCINRKKIVA